ncbi:hypothetical protein BH23GEM11_BH23GEM11_17560 [soil metagenome]
MVLTTRPLHRPPSRPASAHVVASLVVLGLFLGGCAEGGEPVSDPGPRPGTVLPPLEPGTWHLHEAEDRPLPGVVLTPPPGAGLERTQADSSRFQIQSGGRLGFQSWFVRTEADGSITNVATLGSGSWIADQEFYRLQIGSPPRFIVLAPTAGGALVGEQELPGHLGGLTFPVRYLPTPLPPP